MQAIDCGLLFDGRHAETIRDARILIEDGVFDTIGTIEDVNVPDDAAHIDHSDGVVVPGLIDAHVHLTGSRSMDPMQWVTEDDAVSAARATGDLRDLINAGFTTVRDVGSTTGIGLREAVAAGEIPGPRIFTSGTAISQTGGHGDRHMLPYDWLQERSGISTLADGPAECRKEARKHIRDGVDLLKIMTTGGVLSEKDAPDQSQYTDAEISVFTEEAHRVGIPVASHAQGAPGIKRALRNGVDTIEHGFYLDDEALELMRECGAIYVPTLSIMQRIVDDGEEHGVPEYGLEKAREARKAHYDAVKRAYDADIPIALGTDFIGPDLVPHGQNAIEAELFVEEVGMDEVDALRAATSVAARTVPADDLGRIETGYRADLIVLESNPLEDISALTDAEAVYRNGKRADPGPRHPAVPE